MSKRPKAPLRQRKPSGCRQARQAERISLRTLRTFLRVERGSSGSQCRVSRRSDAALYDNTMTSAMMRRNNYCNDARCDATKCVKNVTMTLNGKKYINKEYEHAEREVACGRPPVVCICGSREPPLYRGAQDAVSQRQNCPDEVFRACCMSMPRLKALLPAKGAQACAAATHFMVDRIAGRWRAGHGAGG